MLCLQHNYGAVQVRGGEEGHSRVLSSYSGGDRHDQPQHLVYLERLKRLRAAGGLTDQVGRGDRGTCAVDCCAGGSGEQREFRPGRPSWRGGRRRAAPAVRHLQHPQTRQQRQLSGGT